MEFKRLEEKDIPLMKEIIEDDEMIFNGYNILNFINDKNNYGFIAVEDDKVVGFIYCYSLLKPAGRYMCYVHSVGVLPSYQGKGIGKRTREDCFFEKGCRLYY